MFGASYKTPAALCIILRPTAAMLASGGRGGSIEGAAALTALVLATLLFLSSTEEAAPGKEKKGRLCDAVLMMTIMRSSQGQHHIRNPGNSSSSRNKRWGGRVGLTI